MTSFVLLAILWVSFGAMTVLEFRRRSPALLFVLGLILAAGVSLSVYLFTGSYERAVVVDAVTFVGAFNLLYFATRLVLAGPRVVPGEVPDLGGGLPRAEKRLIHVVGLIFLVPFLVTLARAEFSLTGLAASSWRETYGPSNLLIGYSAHLSFGLILCLVVLRRRVLAVLALVGAAALVIVIRSRAVGLAAVAPLLLFLIFSSSVRGRLQASRLALTVGAGMAALVAFFLVQQIRYLGPLTEAAAANPELVLDAALGRITALGGDFSLVDYFLWMIANGHQVEGYGQLITAQRLLLFWIPPLKPPEFTHSLASAIWGGGQGGSIHPTIYGLSWGEARWFGLLYAPFLASVFRALDWVVRRFSRNVTWTILLGPYTVFAVLAARGALYNAWVVMLLTVLSLLGLIHLITPGGHRGSSWRFADPTFGP